jgi:hypothetical protein
MTYLTGKLLGNKEYGLLSQNKGSLGSFYFLESLPLPVLHIYKDYPLQDQTQISDHDSHM